jgi:hypothetical protein
MRLGASVSLGLLLVCLTALSFGAPLSPQRDRPRDAYHCPMDEDVVSAAPGRCPRCGMTLLPLDGPSLAPHPVALTTTPAALRAGEPGTLHLRVTTPAGAPVSSYGVIHERRMHLFIVSFDLEDFAHVHPELGPDGDWVLPFTFPRPGTYRLLADFLPSGGSPQLVPLTFTTAGTAASVVAHPRLTVDSTSTRHQSGVAVRLTTAAALTAGRSSVITFELSDEVSGQPIGDLEPYLGALGHLLAVSEDLVDAVHAHPLASAPRLDGRVSFAVRFPRAGRYRVWAQFQRRARVLTVPYSVEAVPLR